MATYGIDLGTTNSCIAYVDETGRPVVLKSAIGEDTTPSVVYFESPENVVVGGQAKDSALLVPDLVGELVKREMGAGRALHVPRPGPHPGVGLRADPARAGPRRRQSRPASRCATWSSPCRPTSALLEREATRKAGQIAGLNVLDVLAEPVAAALDYQALERGHRGPAHLRLRPRRRHVRHDGHPADGDDVQVVCTDGDHQLGGADWDEKIIDFLLSGFTEPVPAARPRRRRAVHAGARDLRRAAEEGAEQRRRPGGTTCASTARWCSLS